eukprot:CAMPEP_0181230314 /NCGR_PEP_ID=MMETSP1096-20121128/34403_1 /TAXON_ID=156174 ORGANISM="Chrysochromulina ericina, Strain CCMP281" /NCGR_SAMPLE_ID=MMETSP1096 /ASSEMBLY_ACC=CAM_ASM_000453 /LENGTH=71 /DNA_ID=CAMNT_0023324073 /DNA_START=448 /DNA_END=661 /DNA_ORIENTATION=-
MFLCILAAAVAALFSYVLVRLDSPAAALSPQWGSVSVQQLAQHFLRMNGLLSLHSPYSWAQREQLCTWSLH